MVFRRWFLICRLISNLGTVFALTSSRKLAKRLERHSNYKALAIGKSKSEKWTKQVE